MMDLVVLRLALLLLATDFAASRDLHNSFDPHVIPSSEFRIPDCDHYDYLACPRHLSPVCGNDLNTYGNECILCMKIREDDTPIKIIKDGPC